MALLNRQVLVCYDVPGPELWHERLVLEHVTAEEYIVATPDRDVYCEQLSLLNDDLKGIRVKPSPNALQGGINPGLVYPLPLFNAGEIAGLRLEAQRELATERAARGLGVGGAVPVNQAAGGSNDFVAGTLYWLVRKFGASIMVTTSWGSTQFLWREPNQCTQLGMANRSSLSALTDQSIRNFCRDQLLGTCGLLGKTLMGLANRIAV